jgi:K+-sensing histidine kinase KdpD
MGANCSWLSLDLNDGQQHLGTLILRGSPWTLSFPKEKEFASLLTALASTLQSRQRRRGLQTLSEVRIDQHSSNDVRGHLCLAIASLFNRPTIYLWDGSQKNKAISLMASPIVEPADHLSLNVETILDTIPDKGETFIDTNSFSNSNVANDATAHLMEVLSLDSLILSSFSFGEKRLGVIGIGSAEPWQPTRTEEALIQLVVERVQTTLDNLCFIYQAKRRLALTKRAAYLLSHELKSDPARIVREIEILKKGRKADTNKDLTDGLERISGWAIDHQSTVDRMLMFTWLDSHSWRPFMNQKPLIPLVKDILDQLKGENLGTRCFWFFEHDESEYFHEIDSYSFYLILRNLIQNALQYAPNSPIFINAWADKESTCISFADKGPGVEPQHRDNLFEAFNRGKFNETRTAQQGNLGLGLYLVHELVKLHNGQVTYDTDYQDGARFLLTFPALMSDENL